MSVKLKSVKSVKAMAKKAKKRPNPLDELVEYGVNGIEQEAKDELKAVAGGVSEYAKAIGDQRLAIELNNDTAFYTSIVAESRAQLEAFFKKIGINDLPQVIYLEDLAEKLGIELVSIGFEPKKPKFDKKLAELAD